MSKLRPPASVPPILPASARVPARRRAASTRATSPPRSASARPRRGRSRVLRVASSLDRPDERHRGEHPVERVDVRAVLQQDAHGVRVTAHRRAMQRRDVVLVPGVADRSRTRASSPAPRRCRSRPGRWSIRWCSGRSSLRKPGRASSMASARRAVGARAGRDEAIDRRELVRRAVREEPRRDVVVAVQLGQRVRRAAVGSAPRHVGAVLHEPLDHRRHPSAAPPRAAALRRPGPRRGSRPRHARAASAGRPDCRPTASCTRAAELRRGSRSR